MTTRLHSPSVIKRWLMFNSVGAMGIAIQIGTLFLLTSRTGLGYLLSTGLAVEAAVLHNFVWHERWTWADRKRSGLLRRLFYFHCANGALSIAGNLILMRLFVGRLGMNFMAANILAIGICSILNFLAGDRLVFRNSATDSKTGGMGMIDKSCSNAFRVALFAAALFVFGHAGIQAAELQPETLKAWSASVQNTERRISAELASGKGFLALDFQDSRTAARERNSVLSGDIMVRQVLDADAAKIQDGMIHHWRGSVFIPEVTLDYVLSRVENPRPEDTKQEDVLESRILDSRPGQLKLFLKLQRSKIVTVVYNTEHLVRYQRHGTARASSSSIATRIAELEHARETTEREKPEGRDHGYLWKLNSYWRYQEVNGGVIVECESMTLSRSIPAVLEYMVRPLISSVARESMRRTLESMRTRMTGKVNNNT